MPTPNEAARQAYAELDAAEKARDQGYEGRARVCARRAAAVAARSYFVRRAIELPSSDAMRVLTALRERQEIDAGLRRAIDYLLMRVDTDHQLPPGIDCIAEARRLIKTLLKEE